jgi:single-strand DNA-binding protein
MSLPTMTGVGRLIEAPELRFTSSGKAVAKVRLAFNSRRKNPQTQEWEDGDTYFVDGSVWDQEAENIAESLNKGDEVLVTGLLKTRKYETREGEKRSTTELAIQSIGPSLKYATAKVQKMSRSGAQQGSSGGQRQTADDPWSSAAPAKSGDSFTDEPPF